MKDKHLIFAFILAVLLFGLQGWAYSSHYYDLAVLLTVPIFILSLLGTVATKKIAKPAVQDSISSEKLHPEPPVYFRRARTVRQLNELDFILHVKRYRHLMR